MPTVSVTLLANISGFISPLKAATQAAKDLRTELSNAAAAGKLDAVASSALKAGLALSGGFLLATTAAARFGKQMSEVDAVTGATAGEMENLSKAALAAGKATVFSATEAAKAEAELAKAGLSTADILGGALSGALSLAAAGSLDLSEAADTAAKAMNVFDLQGKDVAHIADVLAAAANKSATDVHELGFALRMGGLAAKNAGLTLEDTVGTLAAFADNALIGSDAGTSLKTMLQALAAPSAEAKTRMKELGIETYDAQGAFIGVTKLAGVLANKLGTLSQEQRNEALATIFGADAMRSATVLYNEGESGIRDYIAAVNDQGAAAEVARKKTDNLMGDIERLTGSLEALFIESGTGASGGLRDLVQMATGLVEAVGSLPAPVLTAGLVITGLAGAGLLAFSAFVKARGAFANVVTELNAMGPAGMKAGQGLKFMAAHLVEATLASLALAEVFEGGQRSIRVNGEFVDDLGKQFNAFGKTTVDTAHNVDKALAEMAAEGHGAEALAKVQQAANNAGISLEFAKQHLPGFTAAMEAGAKGTDKLAGAASKARIDLKALDEQARDNINSAFGLEEAQDKVANAVADLTEQIKKQKEAGDEGAGTLDRNTQAGRDNAASVRGLVGDYQDLVTEYGKAGKSTDGLKQALEDQLVAMHFSRDEAHRYVEQLGLIPPEVTTAVKLEAAQALLAAQETARELRRMLGATISVPVRIPLAGGQRWGGITEHASIGTLREAATYSTRSPARYAFAEPATGGEAFVPKHGDYGRSMAILSQAAGWYGATVSPQGGGGGSSAPAPVVGTMVVNGTVGMSVQELVAAVTRELSWKTNR